MDKKMHVIQTAQTLLGDETFMDRHRVSPQDFRRHRRLTFIIVVLLILQKSLKSLQLVLNEFFEKLAFGMGLMVMGVTASAFTQARQKLSHTAFIELNRKAIVQVYYATETYRTWQGFRLVGIDGSKIRLPNTPAIREVFGTIAISNQYEKDLGEYPWGLCSVCYDLLNDIALDAILAQGTAYEVSLAVGHLKWIGSKDLLIFDRNYPSYRFLATLSQRKMTMGCEWLGRCSRSSFSEVRQLFNRDDVDSLIVTLRPHQTQKKEIQALALPQKITVRLVRVILDNGEVEVLVTSLMDETRYPTSVFKDLYHLRWEVETFFDRVKNRLNLENFSGKSVEAVKQDFYATLFISSLESVLTEEAQAILDQKTDQNRYRQQVNTAVSFNAIKNHVLDLFYTEPSLDRLCDRLTQLFLTTPVLIRPERKVERKKKKPGALLHYYKRLRKICF